MAEKIEMNGMTYMTPEEWQFLPKIIDNPAAILGLSCCPSHQLLLMLAILRPDAMRFVSNQDFWVQKLMVMTDKAAAQYVKGMFPEIREIAESPKKYTIYDVNPPHYVLEAWAAAKNFMKEKRIVTERLYN